MRNMNPHEPHLCASQIVRHKISQPTHFSLFPALILFLGDLTSVPYFFLYKVPSPLKKKKKTRITWFPSIHKSKINLIKNQQKIPTCYFRARCSDLNAHRNAFQRDSRRTRSLILFICSVTLVPSCFWPSTKNNPVAQFSAHKNVFLSVHQAVCFPKALLFYF